MKINSALCLGQGCHNITACYSVAKLTLKVIATNILRSIAPKAVCDDFLDIDGNNNVNVVTELQLLI
jgi:hypothetical protein